MEEPMKINFSLLVIYEMPNVTACTLWLITGIAFVTSQKDHCKLFKQEDNAKYTAFSNITWGCRMPHIYTYTKKITAFLVEMCVHSFELIDQILGETCWKSDSM